MPVTAPSWLTVDSLILRENITLLQMINKEPVKPTENNLASFKESADNSRVRAFTIEREKNLADCLAFLAATTDDPTKIVAVSIEEHVGGHGFTIRLAANSGELEDVLSGLRKIADELESFASNSRNLLTVATCAHIDTSHRQNKQCSRIVTTENHCSRSSPNTDPLEITACESVKGQQGPAISYFKARASFLTRTARRSYRKPDSYTARYPIKA